MERERVEIGVADVGELRLDELHLDPMGALVARVEVGEPLTRAEAVLLIRAVERRCRGPLDADARASVTEKLRAGDEAGARVLDVASRRACGYDFNETVLGGPLDGREHAYECPDCGTRGNYRAPLIQVSG